MRESFGPPGRAFNFDGWKKYLNIKWRLWMFIDGNDGIGRVRKRFRHLMANGVLVWGHMAQANTAIFDDDGTTDVPGDIVFVRPGEEDPQRGDWLASLGRTLSAVKPDSSPDPRIVAIGKHFSDDYDRAKGLPVPKSYSPDYATVLTSVLFVRKHLPKGIWSTAWFQWLSILAITHWRQSCQRGFGRRSFVSTGSAMRSKRTCGRVGRLTSLPT